MRHTGARHPYKRVNRFLPPAGPLPRAGMGRIEKPRYLPPTARHFDSPIWPYRHSSVWRILSMKSEFCSDLLRREFTPSLGNTRHQRNLRKTSFNHDFKAPPKGWLELSAPRRAERLDARQRPSPLTAAADLLGAADRAGRATRGAHSAGRKNSVMKDARVCRAPDVPVFRGGTGNSDQQPAAEASTAIVHTERIRIMVPSVASPAQSYSFPLSDKAT